MILRTEDLYHTGIVVDDIEAAMRSFTAIAGYRWTNVIGGPFTVRIGEREVEMPFRLVYSLDAPHVELVQAVSGTPWVPAPGNAVHHVGYFVDDLEATSAALTAAGLPREACGVVNGHAPVAFAYHKGNDGIRIEIVSRATMPDLAAFLAANAAPEPA